jgi:hypothetical protein
MRTGTWRGIFVEPVEIGGCAMWAATVRRHGSAASRRWFPDQPSAYAWGATEADRLSLPLFDYTDPADVL